MKAIIKHAITKGWRVASKSTRRLRGYLGIKLQRTRREPLGFEFGGRNMLETVRRYMALNPRPVPPIEVSP